jgi:hypothetical protein
MRPISSPLLTSTNSGASRSTSKEAGRTNRIISANVIPAQMAGKIARDAGLADQSGYCPIDPESMKSKVDANIFVVGDAAIPGDMPKSTFAPTGQGSRDGYPGRAHTIARFPGALFQYVLEPDCA